MNFLSPKKEFLRLPARHILVCICLALVSCAPVSKLTGIPEQQLRDGAVTAAEGTMKAVEVLKGAAAMTLPIACATGQLDKGVCDTYRLANSAAAVALPKAETALAAYKSDPSTANGAILDASMTALYEAWSTYNVVNGQTPFVDANGNPLWTTVPTPSPAG